MPDAREPHSLSMTAASGRAELPSTSGATTLTAHRPTSTYSPPEIASVSSSALGTVVAASRVSSDSVAMSSKPMKAKNTSAAPDKTPPAVAPSTSERSPI